MRKRLIWGSYVKLVGISALVGLASAFLADTLKHITAHYEDHILETILLSVSIHAPLTATALGCCFTGGYVIAIPVLIACVVARYVAGTIFKDTVYTYTTAP